MPEARDVINRLMELIETDQDESEEFFELLARLKESKDEYELKTKDRLEVAELTPLGTTLS